MLSNNLELKHISRSLHSPIICLEVIQDIVFNFTGMHIHVNRRLGRRWFSVCGDAVFVKLPANRIATWVPSSPDRKAAYSDKVK